LNQNIEYITQKVPSNVSDMPITLDEIIEWAKNRTNNLMEVVEADYYIWLEWWTILIQDKWYILGVVCIKNKSWKQNLGFSNMLLLPDIVKTRLYKNKEDLWKIIDEMLNQKNVANRGWAFGEFSDWIFTRKDQFKVAFLSAIIPFFNKYYQ
jgi:non-canonical (house-cleaning) NTP pyrophosphatase